MRDAANLARREMTQMHGGQSWKDLDRKKRMCYIVGIFPGAYGEVLR